MARRRPVAGDIRQEITHFPRQLHTLPHIAQIREALEQFRIALSMMLENYRRKAVQQNRAARGYDYPDALDHFSRLVKPSMEARTHARSGTLQDLLLFTQQLRPQT